MCRHMEIDKCVTRAAVAAATCPRAIADVDKVPLGPPMERKVWKNAQALSLPPPKRLPVMGRQLLIVGHYEKGTSWSKSDFLFVFVEGAKWDWREDDDILPRSDPSICHPKLCIESSKKSAWTKTWEKCFIFFFTQRTLCLRSRMFLWTRRIGPRGMRTCLSELSCLLLLLFLFFIFYNDSLLSDRVNRTRLRDSFNAKAKYYLKMNYSTSGREECPGQSDFLFLFASCRVATWHL